jgi:hypothetical protein
MIQEVITVTIVAGQTIGSTKKQFISGQIRQVQAYHNQTDAANSILATINDTSGTPIVKKQPIQNLRSRDASYFSNLPLDIAGGQDIEIIVELDRQNLDPDVDLKFHFVFDVENTKNC